MKKTALAAAMSLLAGTAMAQNFQTEVGINYQDFDGNDSAIGFDGTFHFNTVNTARQPLAEAPFLTRSSNVQAQYWTMDEADLTMLQLGGEMYIENFYAAAALNRTDNGADSNDVLLRAGFMIQDGLRIHAGIDMLDLLDRNDIALGFKYVSKLPAETAFNLEFDLSLVDDDDDTMVYALGGDYYLNHAFSLGATYEDSDADGSEAELGLRARFFFMPDVSIEGNYTDQDGMNTYLIRAAMRI